MSATGFMRSLPMEAALARRWEGEWKNATRLPLDFARRSPPSALRPVVERWKGQGRDHQGRCWDPDKISQILCFLHLAQDQDRDQPRKSRASNRRAPRSLQSADCFWRDPPRSRVTRRALVESSARPLKWLEGFWRYLLALRFPLIPTSRLPRARVRPVRTIPARAEEGPIPNALNRANDRPCG